GPGRSPKRYAVWGPKLIAMIGALPATLEDRAINVRLRRKSPGEKISKLRTLSKESIETLVRKLTRFGADFTEQLRQTEPLIPEQLNDRAADNLEPLLAVAEVAGERWAQIAREAAIRASESNDPTAIDLLSDIRNLFTALATDQLSSQALCA